MLIKKVRLNNFGPYADRTFTFESGLIGVVGKNGSGKSTLLDSIYAALTNDFKRFHGPRGDCVRFGETSAFVEVSFLTNHSVPVTIKRAINAKGTTQSSLTVGDKESITNANDVQSGLRNLIGTDEDFLDAFCFKQQSQISDFITSAPAKRKDFFQEVFQTNVCETVHNQVQAFLREKQVANQIVDDTEELKALIESRSQVLEELTDTLKRLREKILTEDERLSYQQAAKDKKRRSLLRKEKKELAGKLKTGKRLKKQIKARKAEIFELMKANKPKIRDRTTIELIESDIIDGTEINKQIDEAKQAKKTLADISKKCGRLVDDLSTKVPVDTLQRQVDLAKDDLAVIMRDTSSMEKILKALANDSEGNVSCSVCGSDLSAHDPDELQEHLTSGLKRKQALKTEIENKTLAIAKYQQIQSQIETYDEQIVELEKRIKAAEDLEPLDIPTLEKEFAEAVEAEEVQKQLDREQVELSTELKYLRTLIVDNQNRLAQVTKELDAIPSLGNNEIFLLLENDAENRKLFREKEVEQALIDQEVKNAIIALKTTQAKLQQSEKALHAIAILETSAKALHRDGLPKYASLANLRSLEVGINEFLTMFGSPFFVQTNEELEFVCTKQNGAAMVAQRLSTGQKVVLSIAFWLAVSTMFSDTGFLALDEPTANLDEASRKFLTDALQKLTASLQSVGRQVIVVTHSPNMASCFDQIVNLDEVDYVNDDVPTPKGKSSNGAAKRKPNRNSGK